MELLSCAVNATGETVDTTSRAVSASEETVDTPSRVVSASQISSDDSASSSTRTQPDNVPQTSPFNSCKGNRLNLYFRLGLPFKICLQGISRIATGLSVSPTF